MNKFRVVLLWIAMFGLGCPALNAQSADKARTAFATFMQLNNGNGDKGAMYKALYDSYREYSNLLRTAQNGSNVAQDAKNALRTMRPYLQNGAIYNSQKNAQTNAVLFARAYVDIPLMEQFRDEIFPRDDYYPTMVYFAASGTYNSGDYAGAIKYFKEYLATGSTEKRKDVYQFMAKSCLNIKDYELGKQILEEAITAYPTDFNLLSMAINACIDSNDNQTLQRYLTRALKIRPGDATLLNIQGKLYEDTGNYQQAVAVYTQLRNTHPRSLEIAKHLALNYYNLGVLYNNRSIGEKDPKTASRYGSQSRDFFEAAIPTIKDILASDPASLKYLEALATAYQYTGHQDELAATNRQLVSMGGSSVSASSVPSLIAYGNAAPSSSVPQIAANQQPATYNTPEQSGGDAPLYSAYAKRYVEERIAKWQAKDPYETVNEYKQRVTEQTRNAKIKELLQNAEKDYIDLYTRNIRFSDIVLRPYDAENEVFLAESNYGELIIPVPRTNNEARIFESSWNGMQFKDPKFRIDNDRLTLSALTFVTPTGKSYRYADTGNYNYTETVVDMHFDNIDYEQYASAGGGRNDNRAKVNRQKVNIGGSDVDTDIPQTNIRNERMFAVIIANENYERVADVPMALNDGRVFKSYCQKTLGLPEDHIRSYNNATYANIIAAVRDIKDVAAAYSGDISVIFYYAGHGIPNENTRDAFLLPVDADGRSTEVCYSLSRLYSELGGLNARSVFVFLDACFSGANRDGEMLASARGVALKAKKEDPQGNMVIFSAASDDETAFPYEAQGHGLFTYFLLKKLQETKGNVSMAELSNYVTTNVRQQSVVINRKSQTPVISPSVSLSDSWKTMKLVP